MLVEVNLKKTYCNFDFSSELWCCWQIRHTAVECRLRAEIPRVQIDAGKIHRYSVYNVKGKKKENLRQILRGSKLKPNHLQLWPS